MKKASIFSLFIAMMLLLAVPFASASDNKFNDVKDAAWALDAINELSSKKIINGYYDNSFRPYNEVTRADAAVMIARALDLNTDDVEALLFKDVDSKHYAYNAISAVYEAGIMKGYNNNFDPEKALKRGEMAVLLTNAFDLETATKNTFKDVSKDHFAFDEINYLAAHNISIGYTDKTFKPENTTNRAEFAVLLSKALAVQNGEKLESETNADLIALLTEIQNNEINLESYEFNGNAEVSLTFPEIAFEGSEEDAEFAAEFMSLFENIRVHLTGAYVKDPMHLEMLMEVVINEEMGLALEMPVIMTEDAMYMKMGDLLGGSEDEKFIKMDLAELAGMSEQDAAALDMELQFELSKILNELMTKHLIDFYSEVDLSTVEIEHNPNAQKAIKFEVTNDSIESFVQILFEDIMPELLTLMQNPEYAAAFGLTAEDLALLVGQDFTIDFESKEFQELFAELRKALQINELSSHIVIDANNIALDHLMNADIVLTFEGESLGLKVNALLQKQKINEDVTFQFAIPADEDTISMDELYEFDEDFYYDEDFYDEDFDFELE